MNDTVPRRGAPTRGFGAETSAAALPILPEAGFVAIAPRTVTVHGQPVVIAATSNLFYNLRPADDSAESRPIFFLSNGFAAEIVRGYGTGPTTVAEGGAVVANGASLNRFANLVYLEPRRGGYSYDRNTERVSDARRLLAGHFQRVCGRRGCVARCHRLSRQAPAPKGARLLGR